MPIVKGRIGVLTTRQSASPARAPHPFSNDISQEAMRSSGPITHRPDASSNAAKCLMLASDARSPHVRHRVGLLKSARQQSQKIRYISNIYCYIELFFWEPPVPR
jgi:hypothetical protein